MSIELAIVLAIVAVATGSTIGIGLSRARRTPDVRVTTWRNRNGFGCYLSPATAKPATSTRGPGPQYEPAKAGEYCKVLEDVVFHRKGDLVKVESIDGTFAKDQAGFAFHLNDLRPIRKGDKMRILRNRIGAYTAISGTIPGRPALPGDEIIVEGFEMGSSPLVIYSYVADNKMRIYMTDIEHV